MLGLDLSPAALAVAARNRDALELGHLVELRVGDLLEGVPDGVAAPGREQPALRLDRRVPDAGPRRARLRARGRAPGRRRRPGRVPAPACRRRRGCSRPGGAVVLEVGDGQADRGGGAGRRGRALLSRGRRPTSRASGASCGRCVRGRSVLPDRAAAGRDGVGAGRRPAGGRPRRRAHRHRLRPGRRLGLGAGVRDLFAAKGRGEHSPVAAIFASVGGGARRRCPTWTRSRPGCSQSLLPGPYTFVVATAVPQAAAGGDRGFAGGARTRPPPVAGPVGVAGHRRSPRPARTAPARPRPPRWPTSTRGCLARCAVAFGAAPGEPTIREWPRRWSTCVRWRGAGRRSCCARAPSPPPRRSRQHRRGLSRAERSAWRSAAGGLFVGLAAPARV